MHGAAQETENEAPDSTLLLTDEPEGALEDNDALAAATETSQPQVLLSARPLCTFHTELCERCMALRRRPTMRPRIACCC